MGGQRVLRELQKNNNTAEYQGLIWVLGAAKRYHMGPLHVVGDSAMILRQLHTNTPPRSQKLQPLNAQARLLADQIGVRSWRHLYRAHTKMAHFLANTVVDASASAQGLLPSTNIQLAGVEDHMANNVGHWLTFALDS